MIAIVVSAVLDDSFGLAIRQVIVAFLDEDDETLTLVFAVVGCGDGFFESTVVGYDEVIALALLDCGTGLGGESDGYGLVIEIVGEVADRRGGESESVVGRVGEVAVSESHRFAGDGGSECLSVECGGHAFLDFDFFVERFYR